MAKRDKRVSTLKRRNHIGNIPSVVPLPVGGNHSTNWLNSLSDIRKGMLTSTEKATIYRNSLQLKGILKSK